MLSLFVLTALARDPFALGTPWASAFAGLAASPTLVQTVAELRSAVAKGGDVHLAAGTYNLSQGGLRLNSKTVLEGEGQGKTILEVGGAGGTTGDAGSIALFGTDIGLRSLTVRNLNVDAKPNLVMRGHWGDNPNERTFLDSVEFLIGNGLPVNLNRPTDSLVRGCRFVSTCETAGPLRLSGGSGLRFESNFVDYRANRALLTFLTDATITGNEFRLDGHYRGPGRMESGGVELSYAYHVDFDHNKVVQYGPEATDDNDGEMVITQSSSVPEWQGAGRVVSSDDRTVVTDLRWGDDPWYAPQYAKTPRKAIYLLSGAGAGQWRWATARADGTVGVDRPWDVAPRPGDQVSIGSVTAYRLRIAHNTIQGGTRGVELYSGGLECEVVGNTVKDAGGIVVKSDSRRSGRTPRSTIENWPVWDCRIEGNTVTNTTGWRPAAVTLFDVDVSDTGLPLATRNVSIRGNKVRGKGQSRALGPVKESDGVQVLSINQVRPTARADRLSGVRVRDNRLSGASRRVPEALDRAGGTKP